MAVDGEHGVKRAYAGTARALGHVLVRVGVLPEQAPERRRRTLHWLTSLARVHDWLALAELDVPWWTYASIDAIERWLEERRRPIRVFEFGSGASTLWLARRVDHVHTVEHHPNFALRMRPEFARHPNITFHFVPPAPTDRPAIPSGRAGYRGFDFTPYVLTVDRVGGAFDLIAIDGRARAACLRAAIPHLAPDGLIVYDNSRRRRDRRAIRESGLAERRFGGLTPTLPYPERTSLLERPPARDGPRGAAG